MRVKFYTAVALAALSASLCEAITLPDKAVMGHTVAH